MDQISKDALAPLQDHRNLFSLSRSVTYLNHGSVGAVPYHSRSIDIHQCSMKSDPYMAWALRQLAGFIGAEPQDVVFVENATAGTNAVLKSLQLGPQDVVLTISLAYTVVTITLNCIQDLHGAAVHEIEIPLPTTSAEIVRQFELYFEMTDVIPTVAVFDHITSVSALVLPVELDMKTLDPDFYVTNCNKWLFTPRGCALLYVKRKHHRKISPLSTSYGYGHSLQAQFLFPGTHDRSLYLTTPAGLKFYQSVAHATMPRNRALLLLTANFLAQTANGHLLTDGDPDMLALMATIALPKITSSTAIQRVPVHQYRSMALCPIPLSAQHPDWVDYLPLTDPRSVEPEGGAKMSAEVLAAALHKTLRELYGIEVSCYVVDGQVAIRISVQSYNRADEFVALAMAMVEIQETEGGDGEVDRDEMKEVVDVYLADAAEIDARVL
ncbi:pyridoxal phosphate-dependent transferase [Catenaria anguillulae PL171]|uniref:Pyridoxal phosphate-dependent transferase n=1 Tax=Catenaria anguillulae PL171 TaxID=765915 RepID=A0A1Y2HHU5_9FUNG|nr:pyridoxal phosphate-dependent transferase [Catenaria anguillulae PL171]